jgi:hypothetical protein
VPKLARTASRPCAIGDLAWNPNTAFVFIHNRDFRADALFIRAEITVGAQSAQWPLRQRRSCKKAV